MEKDALILYLLVVNAAALGLGGLSARRHSHGADAVLRLLSAAGGAAGLLLSWLIWDRRINKNNVMSRFAALCCLLVQLLAVLALRGPHAGAAEELAASFLTQHRPLCRYLVGINVLTLLLFAWDKLCALRGRDRVPEAVLLFAALFGGSVGALAGMGLCRHKTQSPHFLLGVPLSLGIGLLYLLAVTAGVL